MDTTTKAVEKDESVAATEVAGTKDTTEVPEPSQSSIKKELNKVKAPHSKREKILYKKKILDEELAALEIEEGSTVEALDEDKSKPVTVGMLEEREKAIAQRTAISLADDIEDEDTRELTKIYLQTRIVPSGNPKEDLRFALAAVSSIKNEQIAAEVARKPKAKTSSSGSGAPVRVETEVELSRDEMSYMRPPFNLTKEQIIAARPK